MTGFLGEFAVDIPGLSLNNGHKTSLLLSNTDARDEALV